MMGYSPLKQKQATQENITEHSVSNADEVFTYILVEDFNDSPDDVDVVLHSLPSQRCTIMINGFNEKLAAYQS